jgi:hypothetical protein
MNMPGFTAETSLYKTSGHYRAMAGTPHTLAAAALTLAAIATSSVDCKTFPDNITCHECNSTGPGTLDCCQLRKRGDSCIIVNDPNVGLMPAPRRRGSHAFPLSASGAQLCKCCEIPI